jgi:uncharacterized protein
MPRLEAILPKLRELLPELRASHGVSSLAVFGSVARGNAGAGSDVDVLVEFDPDAKVTLFTLARIKSRLDDALGCDVDLVENHARLGPSFREHIQRDLVRVA